MLSLKSQQERKDISFTKIVGHAGGDRRRFFCPFTSTASVEKNLYEKGS